jgi:hypothetical protein
VGQHLGVIRRRLACATTALVTLGGVVSACDATVTPVGWWEPGSAPPQAGASGHDGAGGEPSPEPGGFYLEAEDGELSGGFVIDSDPAASGGEYIRAPEGVTSDDRTPGMAQARYTFNVDSDGDYLIWGRLYTPDIGSNRFFVQVDDAAPTLWRMTVGTIWFWDDVHDDVSYNQPLHFTLAAGRHELVFYDAAPDAKLDRLYVTAGGDQPPGNDTKCRPPHYIDVDGVCQPSCGAQAPPNMSTTCACAGRSDSFPAYDCGGGRCCLSLP